VTRGSRSVARAAGTALALAALWLAAGGPAADRAAAQAARDSTARDTTAARPARPDTTARRPAGSGGVVPADSLPSNDAREVLRGIPEPLGPGEQVEAPDSLLDASERVAAPDTAAADTSGVPIPAETAPLGERPGGPARSVFSDSLPSASPGSGAAAPPAAPPAAPASAAADTCWRLQLAAPTAREEAAAKRAAAESQLMIGVAIEIEQGRHKVRSRDCLTRAAGEALRQRALLSGFGDAFLVRMGADGKAVPATPAKPAAKKPAARR